MTGIGMVVASGSNGASAPPITGFTIGWSVAKDQFTVSNSGGTFPGNMTITSLTGGTPPYTYLLSRASSVGMSIDNNTDPNTTASYSGMTVTGQQDYLWIECQVTDANGMHRNASTDMGDYLKLTMTRG